jgi:GNAT superfamily N-acetyltransferase
VSDPVIRVARAGDIDAIARLWEALVNFHHELDRELPTVSEDGAFRYAKRILNHIDDPSARVLVAEVDQQVVGYVLGVVVDLVPEMFSYDASGFLADVFVAEPYRRTGVGTALVKALADWFADKGLRYFEWHAAARNPTALAFWKALGGREVMVRMRADIVRDREQGDKP